MNKAEQATIIHTSTEISQMAAAAREAVDLVIIDWQFPPKELITIKNLIASIGDHARETQRVVEKVLEKKAERH